MQNLTDSRIVQRDDAINKPGSPPYKIKIIRSNKRRKTISSRLIKETMLVYAPVCVSDKKLSKIIDNFKKRFEARKHRQQLNQKHDLKTIAERLNKEYFGGSLSISSIEYVSNQNKIFGCCNYKTRKIRISHRLGQMPIWVRDYVIVHEMAHLVEPNHSRAFWNIVSRYKLAERARGYLMAKGLNSEEESGDLEQAD